MSKDHLNSEQFKKYFNGTLSEAERAAFEEQLAKDPFAQEAMEGFDTLNAPSQKVEIINRLNDRIKEETGIAQKRAVVIPFFKIATIAASVLFVVGGVFLVTKLLQNNTQLAQNDSQVDEENTVQPEQSTVGDNNGLYNYDTATKYNDIAEEEEEPEAVIDFTEQQEVDINDIKNDEVPPNIQDNIVQNSAAKNLAQIPEEEVLEEDEYEYKSLEGGDVITSQDNERSTQNAKVSSSEPATTSSIETISVNDVSANQKTESSAPNFSQALNMYQSGKYNDAIKAFDDLIDANTKVVESKYYIGLSYYSLGKDVKAIKSFDEVIGTASSLSANAKWYKALILIKKGKNEDAKVLLRDLINSGSSFKTRAQEKMQQL